MTGAVTVFPIAYRLGDLADVPPEEIAFHLVLSRIANEITILRVQIMLASTGSAGDTPQSHVSAAASILNVKLLAGRIYEEWEFLRSRQSGIVYTAIRDHLPEEVKSLKREIGRYFGRNDNLIQRLRNRISFHIDPDTTYAAVAALDADTELVEYLSEHRGSVYYGGGWILSTKQLQIVMNEPDLDSALSRFHQEVTGLGNLFIDFIEVVNAAFLERHLHLSKEMFAEARVELEDYPDLRHAVIPFFFHVDEYIREVESGRREEEGTV